jgi:hypothetical protein
MQEITKVFEGTKIYKNVIELIEKGKSEFDCTDMTWNDHFKLIELLEQYGKKVNIKQSLFSKYYKVYELVDRAVY